MKYVLKERIGTPLLFCGRKQEMELLLNWVNMIPIEMAKSRALLGRRKSGKSAIMQRLFNILWNQNGPVIPFYFEMQDYDQWLLTFADAYYRTFMSQYLSFKNRTLLAPSNSPWKFEQLIRMATEIGDKSILEDIHSFQKCLVTENIDQSMKWAFDAPGNFAGNNNISVLVMIDEIQYMTKHIYRDKDCQFLIRNLPGAYHSLVESKIAPMLVSGSYVGWMVQMMREMFVGGRLKYTEIPSKLTPVEGLEAVYRYAEFYQLDITDETAVALNQLTQSDPFYIASLLRSDWVERDFSSVEGLIKTLDYEIKNRKGELFGTWSEYIFSTIKEVNDQYAKQILLYLSKERHKECTRTEISNHLEGKLSNGQLEEKLRTLEYGDLITKGVSNFRYSGIPDDILDLIFRELYQEEIEQVKPDISKELHDKVAALEKEKKSLRGALNELKGRLLELIIYREINQARKQGKPITNFQNRLRPMTHRQNLESMEAILTACGASQFQTVWMNYSLSLPQTTVVELDVLARGSDTSSCWALVFEIKNRDEKHHPTLIEAQNFVNKIESVKQQLAEMNKPIKFICPVYLSATGFESSIEQWLHEQGVLTADLDTWEIN
ncbi:hypothetical protein [Candidatus Parabeggiatoa sp. HSG14]|uniref:hypothetical protein n=1 Tax=Candidatus Parabeggiatoa sp. HSG14 TaxID=3055593 RepID=UPI0025A86F91|nr:hypothetical protein [Thiotrichales bacterium HSG14]